MEYQRSYATRACGVSALALAALCFVSPGAAQAEDAFAAEDARVEDATSSDAAHLELTRLRSYALPQDFPFDAANISTAADGRVLYAATTGKKGAHEGGIRDAACTVVVAQDDGARALSYRFQDKPSGCVKVLAHPDGGFFVRGTHLSTLNQQAVPADIGGFTARIDANGRELWALPDQSMVDATAVANGGPGVFVGSYDSAVGSMAYNPRTQRLVTFTSVVLSSAVSRRITQAHTLDAQTGALRASGLTFGFQGGSNVLKSIYYREAEDDFLLHFGVDSRGKDQFFSYNGRRRIDTFSPAGKDWSTRKIPRIVWSGDQKLYILSLVPTSTDSENEVSAYDAAGDVLWSVNLNADMDDHRLGAAENIWVLRDHILVGFRWNIGTFFRILDRHTGEPLGVDEFGMEELTGESPYKIVALREAADETARLLRLETQPRLMREERVDIISGPQGSDDADAGFEGSDAQDEDEDAAENTGGCAMNRDEALPPISALSLAFSLLVFTIAHRRRNHQYTGEE